MNNTFSFERFLKVLKYDLKFRVPGFMVTYIVLLTCMHILFFAFNASSGEIFSTTTRETIINGMWMICSFLAPFKIYSAIRNKHGRAQFIMLPASTLEKFASMFVISVIIVPVSFLLLSYALDSLLTIIFKDIYLNFISLNKMNITLGFKAILCTVSTAMLGNAIFKKGAIAKTFIIVMTLCCIWSYLMLDSTFSNIIKIGNVDQSVVRNQMQFVTYITQYVYIIVSVFIYVCTSYRLKKMQIS